ncbi:YtxH domain-containing protein [Cellulomonas sp. Marseille-Q8402]
MKGKLAFVLGAGVGYVLGTRAGRAQFEKIKGWASDAWHDPRVQSTVDDLESTATRFAKDQGVALKDKAVDAVKSAVSRSSDDDAGSPGTAGTPGTPVNPGVPETPPPASQI